MPVVSASAPETSQSVDAVVAFGSRAALRGWPESAALVTCLAPGARPRRDAVLRVELMPVPAALLERLKMLQPGLKTLRVLWSSELAREEVDGLAAAAAAVGVAVRAERIEDPAELPARVRAFEGPADAFWVMPDPLLVTAQNFAVLREYSQASRTPFYAPTEGLAERGATATLAASFRESGRTAASALKARLNGVAAAHVHPARLTVTVNAAAARAAGLDVDAAKGVDRILR